MSVITAKFTESVITAKFTEHPVVAGRSPEHYGTLYREGGYIDVDACGRHLQSYPGPPPAVPLPDRFPLPATCVAVWSLCLALASLTGRPARTAWWGYRQALATWRDRLVGLQRRHRSPRRDFQIQGLWEEYCLARAQTEVP